MPKATVQLLVPRLADGHLSRSTVAETSTNDLGEYRVFDVPPGRYYVAAFYRDAASVLGLRRRSDGTATPEQGVFDDYAVTYYPGVLDPNSSIPLNVTPGKTLSGIDFDVEITRSFALEGRVENLPLSGEARVFLEPADFGALGPHQVFPIDGKDPRFIFQSVPPGDYVLRVHVISGAPQLSALQPISVSGAPVRGIMVPLRQSPQLVGLLRTTQGISLKGVHLTFAAPSQPVRAEATVQQDGKFSIGSIPLGRYRIGVSGASLLLKTMSVDGQRLSSDVLEVDRSIDSLTVTAVLSSKLQGSVHEADGNALSHGLVVAVYSSDQSLHVARIANGSFAFDSLLPGEYRVSCFADLTSEQDLVQTVVAKVISSGEEVVLAEGEVKSVDLRSSTVGDD